MDSCPIYENFYELGGKYKLEHISHTTDLSAPSLVSLTKGIGALFLPDQLIFMWPERCDLGPKECFKILKPGEKADIDFQVLTFNVASWAKAAPADWSNGNKFIFGAQSMCVSHLHHVWLYKVSVLDEEDEEDQEE